MSRGRAIAGGAAVLVGSQVVVTVVQVGTGAATARLLAPAAFGAFAAAIAFTGLLGVILTSATATAVLREHELTPARVSKLFAIAAGQGAVGGAVAWLAAPAWAALYDTPNAESMLRWLAIQVALSPLAVTSSALLRREQRAFADAVTQAGSVIVGLLVGLSAVWIWRDGVLLVVSPIVAAATLLLGTLALRSVRYGWVSPDRSWSVRRANNQIVLQNLYFFALSAVPVWLVSQAGDAHELGLYSRASAVPSMVVGAVTVGLVRSAQPYYRSVPEESRGSALRDLVVMTGAVGIPVMTLLAATAEPLMTVWLGARWTDGARYIPIVAAGSAAYLMFTLLANAAETLSYLREVRLAQVAMFPGLVAVAAVSWSLKSAVIAAATIVVVALPGLTALVVVLARRGMHQLNGALPAAGVQLGVGVTIGLAGWLCSRATDQWGSWLSLLLSAALVALLFVVTLPLRPEWAVLRSRGLLPRQFRRSVDASSGASL
jgi:O-antigen/teichoic acid export membrane protein